MKLFIGLGNPGEKYQNTRHNVGFMVIDALDQTKTLTWHHSGSLHAFVARDISTDNLYAKPDTFMNESGVAVKSLLDFYKISPDDLYLIHDDLDLKLGAFKLQKGTGPKDHNGLNSVYEKLSTHNFWHLRVGVDARPPSARTPGEDYVLEKFSPSELKIITQLLPDLIQALPS